MHGANGGRASMMAPWIRHCRQPTTLPVKSVRRLDRELSSLNSASGQLNTVCTVDRYIKTLILLVWQP
jgi:hypothetical protein